MYVATINTPGYLPQDDDPPVFETVQEAWQYLLGEVDRYWDDYPDDPNGACLEAHTAMHILDQSQVGSVHAPTPGYEGDHDLGIAYSVSEVESPVEHGFADQTSGVILCKCGWKSGHYAIATDADPEFDDHLLVNGVHPL